MAAKAAVERAAEEMAQIEAALAEPMEAEQMAPMDAMDSIDVLVASNEFDEIGSTSSTPSSPQVIIDLKSVAAEPPKAVAMASLIPKRMKRMVRAPIMTIDLEEDEKNLPRREESEEPILANPFGKWFKGGANRRNWEICCSKNMKVVLIGDSMLKFWGHRLKFI